MRSSVVAWRGWPAAAASLILLAACAPSASTSVPSPSLMPDVSAIIVLSADENVQPGPANPALLLAVDQAWQFAQAHADQTGYPWLDPATGELVLSAATAEGRRLLEVEAAALPVPYRIREVAHSFAELQEIQEAVTHLRDQGVRGAELVWAAFPDQRDNRTAVRITEMSQALLEDLAARFGGDAIAVQVSSVAPGAGAGNWIGPRPLTAAGGCGISSPGGNFSALSWRQGHTSVEIPGQRSSGRNHASRVDVGVPA